MEKEPEKVTEEVVREDEVDVTALPEVNLDATEKETEEEKSIFESTTILPEEEEEKVEEVNPEPSTQAPIEESQKEKSTTENIYDEVRKSLSNLFSESPAGEETTTTNPESKDEPEIELVKTEVEEEKVATEEVLKDSTTTTPAPEEVKQQQEEDVATELAAHVVELPAEPEVKANVTEINRTYVIATSTSKQVSHETEICYRGRCIKSVEAKTKN